MMNLKLIRQKKKKKNEPRLSRKLLYWKTFFYKEEARVVQHDAARAAKVTLGMKVHGAGGTIGTSCFPGDPC